VGVQGVIFQANRGRLRAVLTVIGVIVAIAFFLFLAIMGFLAKLHRVPR
jgi:threonine/homoserine/homoserine lactone efflux protein